MGSEGYDAINAEDIKRGDNIEFPPNDPGVKWYVEADRALKPPCDEPGVQWFVEQRVGEVLVSPLGDLHTFIVTEVGGPGTEVEVRVRAQVPVRRHHRNH
jgi:hypothetical protein